MFAVTILGNNSALPAYDRHPSAQIVTIYDQLLLIDCGEGTQMQLSRYKIRRGKTQSYFYLSFTRRSLFWIDWINQQHGSFK